MSEPSNWDLNESDELSFSGAQTEGPWDDGDEFGFRLPDDDLWDAFELDDALEDPQPEYGDFWPERDDDEQEEAW